MRKKLILLALFVISFLLFIRNTIYAEENSKSAFGLSFGARYLSRFTAYGIDLADESQAWALHTSAAHKSGFYADARFTRPVSSPDNAQQFSFDIGYEKELSSRISVSAEFSQYLYSGDTVNVLSQFSNMISLNAECDLTIFDLGFTYDHFLGGSGATYLSLDASTFQQIGPVYILPVLQLVFISQTFEENYFVKDKHKKKESNTAAVTTKLTGLVNTLITIVAVYPVFKNVSLSFVPLLILNHQEELSAESSRIIWSAGIRYKFKI
jgi:hypothetical protein